MDKDFWQFYFLGVFVSVLIILAFRLLIAHDEPPENGSCHTRKESPKSVQTRSFHSSGYCGV